MIRLLAFLLLWIPAAHAQLTIEITGAGAQRIPIAIVPFAGESTLPPGISTIVRADLERSGFFRGLELPPIVPEPTEATSINYSEWRSRLGDALLVGSVQQRPDGRFEVRFRVHDVVKQQPLGEYRVIHFAAHGIVSTKYPARSALVLLPGGGEDGLLQAREILSLRLRAALVTLSACDTGAGGLYGQEGVSSLVRPFLAAGARTVVANLWSADDTFSLAIMREFYRQLAAGADKGEALRKAKLTMLRRFGPQAVPKLWSGLLMYGDSVGAVIKPRGAATN